MNVQVIFFGFQRAITKAQSLKVPFVSEMRAADVLAYVIELFPQLGLKENEISIMVNDHVCMKDRMLQNDDTVSFFPHIGGG